MMIKKINNIKLNVKLNIISVSISFYEITKICDNIGSTNFIIYKIYLSY